MFNQCKLPELLAITILFSGQLGIIHSFVTTETINALYDLYISTSGSHWVYPSSVNDSSKWNFSSAIVDPCGPVWAGLTCDKLPDECTSGHLCSVTSLNLDRYNITGTIPVTLKNLRNISFVDVSNNVLHGEIDFSIFYGMKNLYALDLGSNFALSGSLPSSLSLLTALSILNLRYMNLTGNIPEEIGNMTTLVKLWMGGNKFFGTLPLSIGKLSNLKILSLRQNAFHGDISSLSTLYDIEQLSLYSNKFGGIIPSSLGSLTKLIVLYLSHNYFVGQIPSELGTIVSFKGLYLYSNSLTGPIPSSFCSLQYLQDFYLSYNKITGTIPSCIGSLVRLRALSMDKNDLRGTIPSTVGDLTSMVNLTLSSNHFEGTLPSTLSNLAHLRILSVRSNELQGNINLFSSFVCKDCSQIDISRNAFTGSIPSKIFTFPILDALILSPNCFSGDLPSTLCSSTSLKLLVMQGLSYSESCSRNKGDPLRLFSKTVSEELPLCLLNMSNLEFLNIAGNVFKGNLQDVSIRKDSRLKGLSMTSNAITGPLSDSLLTWNFSFLDLSWNAISGTVNALNDGCKSPEFLTNASINLQVNKFSGYIPVCLDRATTVNILEGNLFNCDWVHSRNGLPDKDPYKGSSFCGSELYDISLITFGILFILFVTILLYIFTVDSSSYIPWKTICSAFQWKIKRWYLFFTNRSSYIMMKDLNIGPNMHNYLRTLHGLLKSSLICSSIMVIISFIAYSSASGYWSDYTYQYSWRSSLALNDGYSVCIMVIFIWTLCTFTVIWRSYSQIKRWLGSKSELEIEKKLREKLRASDPPLWRTVLIVVFNTVAVMTAYLIYSIYQLSSNTSSSFKVFLQLLLGAWSLVWNTLVVERFVSILGASIELEIFLKLFMKIFNTLFIPAIATAVSSSDCFKGIFIGSGDITAEVTYTQCTRHAYSNNETYCEEQEDVVYVGKFPRPFIYNSGCAHSVITTYVPVLISSYSIQLVSIPLLYLLMSKRSEMEGRFNIPTIVWALTTTDSSSRLLRGGPVITSIFSHLSVLFTYGLSTPPLAIVISIAMMESIAIYCFIIRRYIKTSPRCCIVSEKTNRPTEKTGNNPIHHDIDTISLPIDDESVLTAPISECTGNSPINNISSSHVDESSAINSRLNAVDGLGKNITQTSIDNINVNLDRNEYTEKRETLAVPNLLPDFDPTGGLEKVSSEIPRDFRYSVWMVTWSSAVFWTLLLFDIANYLGTGAEDRWEGLWIPMLMLSLPAIMYICMKYREHLYNHDGDILVYRNRDSDSRIVRLNRMISSSFDRGSQQSIDSGSHRLTELRNLEGIIRENDTDNGATYDADSIFHLPIDAICKL